MIQYAATLGGYVMKNLKMRRNIAGLLAVLQLGLVSGCASKDKSENLDDNYLELIDDLQAENSELNQTIGEQDKKIADLEKLVSDLREENEALQSSDTNQSQDSTEPDVQEEQDIADYIANAFAKASDRSVAIQNAENPLAKLYETYSYVSNEFRNVDGLRLVWVRLSNGENSYPGLFNLDTMHEDIPCDTFDTINNEFTKHNYGTYMWVGTHNNGEYYSGLYDTRSTELVIPCNNYTSVTYEGDGIYRCENKDGSIEAVQLPVIDEAYQANDIFVYDKSLDSLSDKKDYNGRSFFITVRNAYDQDSINNSHTHILGGEFNYNYGKPYYSSHSLSDIGVMDVILYLSEDKPTRVLFLDAKTQDNVAYGSNYSQYGTTLFYFSDEISPNSGMTLNKYLYSKGFGDLVQDEYTSSELQKIQEYIEQLIENRNR